MSVVEIIVLKNELDYKIKYQEVYLNGGLSLLDIPVIFDEKTFDHLFSEKENESGNRKFSFRRARRMMFIKAILSGEFEKEIMFELDTGNCAIFCVDLESVVYLRLIKGKGLQIVTFFDFGKEHTKMYLKQKKKCIEITLPEIKNKIF